MDDHYDDLDNSVSDQIWTSIPDFIKWLQTLQSSDHRYGVNLTIILHSTTLIEGFLFDLLEAEVGLPVQTKKLSDRLLVDLNKKLENSTWTTYIDLFELVTTKKLSSMTDNQTWKGINALFQLRNMLTHGKTIELKFYKKNLNEPIITTKYSNILRYLNEVGIVNPKGKDYNPKSISIITAESANHFYKLTDKFLADIYKKHLKTKKNTNNPTTDSYEIAFFGDIR